MINIMYASINFPLVDFENIYTSFQFVKLLKIILHLCQNFIWKAKTNMSKIT